MGKDEFRKETNNKQRRAKNWKRGAKPKKEKKVEIDVDRDDINRADLRGGDSTENDFQWYNNYPELITALGNFAYSSALGRRIYRTAWTPVNSPSASKPTSITTTYSAVPGIMRIKYAPIIGNTAAGSTAAYNMAGLQLFAYQRSRNSRSKSYDMPNLMMYIEGIRSLIGLFWKLARVYGCMNLSTPFNKYLPETLVRSLGFDYGDLKLNKAQFRSLINQLAIDLAKLKVPAGMSVIDRNAWMNNSLFIDSNTVKAQFYCYDQTKFYRYTEAVQGPAYLQMKDVESYLSPNSSLLTTENTATMITDLMQPMLESEDIGDILSDIIKAYGLENLYNVPQIAEEYIVTPIYSQEVLSQIENCNLVGELAVIPQFYADMPSRTNLDIVEVVPSDAALGSPYVNQVIATQFYNPNGLDTNTAIGATAALAAKTAVINMHKQDVQIQDTVVATRLTAVATSFQAAETDYLLYDTLGTELALTAEITQLVENLTTRVMQEEHYEFCSVLPTSGGTQAEYQTISAYIAFDWAPNTGVLLNILNSDSSLLWRFYPLKDFDNYVELTADEIAGINEACIRSEYLVKKLESLSSKPN